MRRTLLVTMLWLLSFSGCPAAPAPAGDEVMGTFAFTADPVPENAANCPLSGLPDGGFSFQAVLWRNHDGGAVVAINAVANSGSFDGQALRATYSAARAFPNCGKCTTTLTETFAVALLSQTQSQAVGEHCPDAPLDGGVPAADDDAGISGPGSTATGFDAVRACGELLDITRADPTPNADTDADGGCVLACNACQLRYVLTGERR